MMPKGTALVRGTDSRASNPQVVLGAVDYNVFYPISTRELSVTAGAAEASVLNLAESLNQPSGSVLTWAVSGEFGALPAGYTLQSSGTLSVQAGSSALNGATVVYLTRIESWNGGPSWPMGYDRVNVIVNGGVWLNDAIASMSAAQIGAIPVSQVRTIEQWRIGMLSAAQIAGLTWEQIRAMSPSQFNSLSAAQISALSAQQKQGVTYSQRGMLSAEKLAALGSGNPFMPLTDAQILALTPAQVAVLDAEVLAAIAPAQMHLWSSPQLAAFAANQLGALSPQQVAGLSVGQLLALSKTQLAALSVGQISLLNTEQLAAITPATEVDAELAVLLGRDEPQNFNLHEIFSNELTAPPAAYSWSFSGFSELPFTVPDWVQVASNGVLSVQGLVEGAPRSVYLALQVRGPALGSASGSSGAAPLVKVKLNLVHFSGSLLRNANRDSVKFDLRGLVSGGSITGGSATFALASPFASNVSVSTDGILTILSPAPERFTVPVAVAMNDGSPEYLHRGGDALV
jgi:hypothetical protein